MTEWNREKVKKVLSVLKDLKGFERLPLPMEIHKEFDIPLNKPKAGNVMDYFERYMTIQSLPVDKVEIIDGTKLHKDVVFPTSILEPPKNNYSEIDFDTTKPNVILHDEKEPVFSNEVAELPMLKEENDEQHQQQKHEK